MEILTTSGLQTAIRWAGYLFLGCFTAVIASSLLTGRISLHGLLDHKIGSKDGVSSGRVQMLISTLAISALYLNSVLRAAGSSALPEVPKSMLEIAGGSQALYLSGKGWRLAAQKIRELLQGGDDDGR